MEKSIISHSGAVNKTESIELAIARIAKQLLLQPFTELYEVVTATISGLIMLESALYSSTYSHFHDAPGI